MRESIQETDNMRGQAGRGKRMAPEKITDGAVNGKVLR